MSEARQSVPVTPQQRSSAAVREFKKMLPGLTAFVRALTGSRSMTVAMDAQSATDGKRVYIRPPMALADSAVHDRSLCDVREGNELLCSACRRLEEIYTVIYHEISHNVAGSLEKYPPFEMGIRAVEAAAKHGSPEYLTFISEQVERLAMAEMMNVYEYGDKISKFLLGFIRSMDDFRIDRAAGDARPGVEIMRWHQTELIMDRGMENERGEFQRWSERSPELQIPIAILVGKQGHELESRFDERIIELFRVPVFEKLLAREVDDMLDVLDISVALLGELNKLGLYQLPLPSPPSPPDAEPEEIDDSAEPEENGSGNGESGNKPGDTEDSESEPGEDTSQQGEKDGQDAGSGNGQGHGSGNNSGDPDPEPASDNSDGSDSGQDDESAPSPADGNEQGGGENDERPSDPGDGTEENSADDAVGTQEAGENGNDAQGNGDGSDSEEHSDGSHGGNVDNDPEAPDADASDGGDNGTASRQAHEPDVDSSERGRSTEGDSDGDSSDGTGADVDGENSEPEESEDGGGGSYEITGTIDGPDFSDVEHSTAEEIQEAMEQASGHDGAEAILGGKHSHKRSENDEKPEKENSDDPMVDAINKALVFDNADSEVRGLKVFTGGNFGAGWKGVRSQRAFDKFEPLALGELSPSILHARRVFSDSKLDKNVRNLRKGKIAPAKLGARAWNPKDDRLFQKKIRAQGIDDEVVIGMDLSGSTASRWNVHIKKTAFAMADVLAAVGVKFSIYGHTTDGAWDTQEFMQHIYEVKAVNHPWGPQQQLQLALLPGLEGSLDGHNLEFYRKVLQRSTARRKTLVYYTDGQIPETNSAEEAQIITRELAHYKRLGFNILCVAFGTDGPKNYGLDTIRISKASDVLTVIKELESRITS